VTVGRCWILAGPDDFAAGAFQIAHDGQNPTAR